jgi:hypothetical protein
MATSASPILDRFGRVMFTCTDCGEPLSSDDFFDLNLRFPDPGESQDDYYTAELLDGVSHRVCSEARRAGKAC